MRQLPATIETPNGPSVQGASPGLLAELLRELEHEVVAYGGTKSSLRQGVDLEVLRETFAFHQLSLPEELEVWFGWHDGETRGALFCPPSSLLSLEDSFGMRALEMEQDVGEPLWDWDPQWLRITGDSNAGGAIRCSSSARTPLVRTIMDEVRTHPSSTAGQVVSLCTPVTWWIEAIRSGHYHWTEGGWARDSTKNDLRRTRTGWM